MFVFYLATHQPKNNSQSKEDETQVKDVVTKADSLVIPQQGLPVIKDNIPTIAVVTKKVRSDSLVAFAESLIGIPYKYASTDPLIGFDCSGFITYVFNHYNIDVPRSSKDFVNTGTEIPVTKSRRGDLILFTGTDSTERIIGHMGIVVSNSSEGVKFIHATSGKAHSVVITPFSDYYKSRFVKTIRVLDK